MMAHCLIITAPESNLQYIDTESRIAPMFKKNVTRIAACAYLSMMCSGIALADGRTCSDPQVKDALTLKAQNSRNSYVDVIN
jgi:hypothetical protein